VVLRLAYWRGALGRRLDVEIGDERIWIWNRLPIITHRMKVHYQGLPKQRQRFLDGLTGRDASRDIR